jgi:hypothetical protein
LQNYSPRDAAGLKPIERVAHAISIQYAGQNRWVRQMPGLGEAHDLD